METVLLGTYCSLLCKTNMSTCPHFLWIIGLLMMAPGFLSLNYPTVTQGARTHNFTVKYTGEKLNGKHLSIRQIRMETGCAILCSQTAQCKSVNHCGKRLCFLNSDDHVNIGTSKFLEDENCVYIGMDQHAAPSCLEKGVAKWIRNDTHPGFCEINQEGQLFPLTPPNSIPTGLNF